MSSATIETKPSEQGKEPFEKAKEAGVHAAEKAKEAVLCVGEMAAEAVNAVGQKADDLTAEAGADLKKFGKSLGNNSPHEGVLGHASQAFAETVRDSGKYLEDAKLSGMAGDVSKAIQKHPIPAVLIGVGIGFLLARTLGD